MFNLTRQEKRMILFLISVALLGISIDYFIKRNSCFRVIGYLNQDNDIGKINLNQADTIVLQDIPGVGEVLSKRIIEYRSYRGAFKEIEELQKIKGIGKEKFNKIREYFSLE